VENIEISVFEDEVLSDATDMVERTVSRAIQVPANTVRLSVLVKNLTAGGRIHFKVEGTYDGKRWTTTGISGLDILNVGTSPTSQSSGSAVATDYALLRVRAYVTGGPGVYCLFLGTLAFSQA
jgi:hypothetical protein